MHKPFKKPTYFQQLSLILFILELIYKDLRDKKVC